MSNFTVEGDSVKESSLTTCTYNFLVWHNYHVIFGWIELTG